MSNCNQSHKDLSKNPVVDQPKRYVALTKPTQDNKKIPPSAHQRCRLAFIVSFLFSCSRTESKRLCLSISNSVACMLWSVSTYFAECTNPACGVYFPPTIS